GVKALCCLRAPVQVPAGAFWWRVVNKIDLLPAADLAPLRGMEGEGIHVVSSATGAGVDALVRAIERCCEEFFTPEPALVTRERQRRHLKETAAALRDAQDAAITGGREAIVAELLRLAPRPIGTLAC